MLVIATFDIRNATSEDYEHVTEELEALGLYKEVTGDKDFSTSLPNNTYAGEFNAVDDTKAFAKEIRDTIKKIITARNKRAKVYVVVAPGKWAWASSG